MFARSLLIIPVLLCLVMSASGQAIERRHLVTSIGGGAGLLHVMNTPDSLAASGITAGSLTFGFEYALADRWSIGLHYDRIGSDRTGNSIELLRYTTYLLEGTYRPLIGKRNALEVRLGLGPSIMAAKPFGQNLPLKAQNGTVSLSLRYIHLFTETLGAFLSAVHTTSNGLNVVDYDGHPIKDSEDRQLRMDWNSQRLNAGLFVRF